MTGRRQSTTDVGNRALLRRAVVVAASLALPLLLAGTACGTSGSKSAASTTSRGQMSSSPTSIAASPTSTIGARAKWTAAQERVIQGYLAARAALSNSLAHPDPMAPALAATNTGPMLVEAQNLNADWKAHGEAGRFPPHSVSRIIPTSVVISGRMATIDTCGVDDSIVYLVATGRVLNAAVVTVFSRSTMTLVGGAWKVTTRSELKEWKGVSGCAVASS